MSPYYLIICKLFTVKLVFYLVLTCVLGTAPCDLILVICPKPINGNVWDINQRNQITVKTDNSAHKAATFLNLSLFSQQQFYPTSQICNVENPVLLCFTFSYTSNEETTKFCPHSLYSFIFEYSKFCMVFGMIKQRFPHSHFPLLYASIFLPGGGGE